MERIVESRPKAPDQLNHHGRLAVHGERQISMVDNFLLKVPFFTLKKEPSFMIFALFSQRP